MGALGPTNDGDGFSFSADFKCFRKGVWAWGGGPPMMMGDFFSGIDNQIVLVGGTMDYFKTLCDLIFKISIFTPTMLK